MASWKSDFKTKHSVSWEDLASFVSRFLPIAVFIGPSSERVDLALGRALKTEHSRKKLKQAFASHQVLWNQKPLSPKFRLPPGNHTLLLDQTFLQGPSSLLIPSTNLNLPPLYEDERFFVLNKPSGIASVTQDPFHPETAMGSTLARLPELAKIMRPSGKKEAGLLHRLDTGTSGILVFAKDQMTFNTLFRLWKSSEVKKIYRCLVTSPATPQIISYPLAKHPTSSKKMVAITQKSQNFRGQPLPAMTYLLKEHKNTSLRKIRDLEIQILTGVRHQIRTHLAAIHCPILGDPLYHGAPSERIWLHAWKLILKLPHQTFHWEATLPETWPG